jgi:hypothetical protein
MIKGKRWGFACNLKLRAQCLQKLKYVSEQFLSYRLSFSKTLKKACSCSSLLKTEIIANMNIFLSAGKQQL